MFRKELIKPNCAQMVDPFSYVVIATKVKGCNQDNTDRFRKLKKKSPLTHGLSQNSYFYGSLGQYILVKRG